MCQKGTYVTSLTVYVSSNHYSNTGNPNYLGACLRPCVPAAHTVTALLDALTIVRPQVLFI